MRKNQNDVRCGCSCTLINAKLWSRRSQLSRGSSRRLSILWVVVFLFFTSHQISFDLHDQIRILKIRRKSKVPLEAVPYSEEYKDHLSKSADFLKEVKHFSDLKIGSTLLFDKNVFAFVPFSFVAFHDSSTRPRKRRTTPRWPSFSEHELRYLFLSNRLSWRFSSCFCLYVVLVKFAIGVHLLLPRRSWITSTASRTGSGSMLIQGLSWSSSLSPVPLSHLSNRVYLNQNYKHVSSGFRLPSVLTR